VATFERCRTRRSVISSDQQELLDVLESGPCHRFSDWPNPSVPKVAAGVYTVWERGRLVYVGMSGRALTAEGINAPDGPSKTKGLWTRLNSHASGRRSGDQFCVYVCDRFVIPHLSVEQQAQLGNSCTCHQSAYPHPRKRPAPCAKQGRGLWPNWLGVRHGGDYLAHGRTAAGA